MKSWVAIAAVAALFFTGVLIGALGLLVFHLHGPSDPGETRPGIGGMPDEHPRGRGAELFLGHLERRLDLTPDQRAEIRGILEEAHRKSQALREEVRPKVLKVLEDSHAQVLEVLTPEQAQAFEKLQRQHRPRAERFLLGESPFHDRHHQHPRRLRRPGRALEPGEGEP